MDKEKDLKEVLREVSNAISKSLSAPETMEKLEQLHKQGYQLYLVLESGSGDIRRRGGNPIMPIQVAAGSFRSRSPRDGFELSDDDKNFLRTLKIKVD